MRFSRYILVAILAELARASTCQGVDLVGSPVNFINEYLASLFFSISPEKSSNLLRLSLFAEKMNQADRVLSLVFVVGDWESDLSFLGMEVKLPLDGSLSSPRSISKFIQSSDLNDVKQVLGINGSGEFAQDLCGDLRLTFLEYFQKRDYVSDLMRLNLKKLGQNFSQSGNSSQKSVTEESAPSRPTASEAEQTPFKEPPLPVSNSTSGTQTTLAAPTKPTNLNKDSSKEPDLPKELTKLTSQASPSQREISSMIKSIKGESSSDRKESSIPFAMNLKVNQLAIAQQASSTGRGEASRGQSLSRAKQKDLSDFLDANFDYNTETGRRSSGELISDDELRLIYNLIMEILEAPFDIELESILNKYTNLLRLQRLQFNSSPALYSFNHSAPSSLSSTASISSYPSPSYTLSSALSTPPSKTPSSTSSTATPSTSSTSSTTTPSSTATPSTSSTSSTSSTATSSVPSVSSSKVDDRSSSVSQVSRPSASIILSENVRGSNRTSESRGGLSDATRVQNQRGQNLFNNQTQANTTQSISSQPQTTPPVFPFETLFKLLNKTKSEVSSTTESSGRVESSGSLVRPTVHLYQASYGPNAPLPVTYSNRQFGFSQPAPSPPTPPNTNSLLLTTQNSSAQRPNLSPTNPANLIASSGGRPVLSGRTETFPTISSPGISNSSPRTSIISVPSSIRNVIPGTNGYASLPTPPATQSSSYFSAFSQPGSIPIVNLSDSVAAPSFITGNRLAGNSSLRSL